MDNQKQLNLPGPGWTKGELVYQFCHGMMKTKTMIFQSGNLELHSPRNLINMLCRTIHFNNSCSPVNMMPGQQNTAMNTWQGARNSSLTTRSPSMSWGF
ncbi:hypothetical protein HS088_TW04G00179 [Tripterygium wilfordii]|uniref:Uncharacterized protein n=1 Tax=Tripterygium wilfordii TaxID=458696 RepID=A0A7J7DPF4_TRIWF|nr:hypothetical protein HS088_TW04G00179 [Tripterygium wilfordii]